MTGGTSIAKSRPPVNVKTLAAAVATLTALVAVPAIALAGERVRPSDGSTANHDAFRAQVLGVLERHPSEIARNTLAAVQGGMVVFETLDRLSIADCRQLVEENPAQWSGVVSADECIASDEDATIAKVPARILQRVSGYQHENRIYVRADAKVKDAAATLVHETNHVANATHERYSTAREKLEEEYRAYWVALLFTDGRAPGAGYLLWLKGWIIEQYSLAGVSPGELGDRPAGNLDNRFPTVPAVALRSP